MNKSIYKYAAEAGIPTGLYLTLMSGCFLLSPKYDFLSMLIFPLMLVFPVVVWALMKRVATLQPLYSRFSPLWLFGIYSIIFGTLICALVSGVYLVFVDPGFMTHYVESAIANIQESPMAGQYAQTIDMMQDALDRHMLPSGLQFVATMGWFTCFSGAMLSLVMALIVSRGNTKKRVSMFR